MSIYRIEQLKINERGFITLIYGSIKDKFVDNDLRAYRIEGQLYLYLKKEGFKRILFFDVTQRILAFDYYSLNCCFTTNPEENIAPNQDSVNDGRPMGGSSLLKRRNQNIASNQTPSGRDSKFKEYDGFLQHDEAKSNQQVVSILMTLLRNNKEKTIVIFRNAEQIAQLQGLRDNIIIHFSDIQKNFTKNKVIFIFEQKTDNALIATINRNTIFNSTEFINDVGEGAYEVNTESCYRIDSPDENEIYHLMQRFRLLYNTQFEWAEVKEIAKQLSHKYLEIEPLNKVFEKFVLKSNNEQWNHKFFVAHKILESQTIEIDYEAMKEHLGKVQGQGDTVPVIQQALKSWFGLKKRQKPLSFFLVGTSGVGKTYTAKMLAKSLEAIGYIYSNYDMTDYSDEHTVSKLIGSPPGFVGSQTRPKLFDDLKKSKRLVILFDEIEKAHSRIPLVLMQLLDEGRLTWNNERGDFSQCIIFFTSNAERDKMVEKKKNHLAPPKAINEKTLIEPKYQNDLRDILTKANFAPELCGRINYFLVYNPLNGESIIHITVQKIMDISQEYDLHILHISPTFLAETAQKFADSRYGVRDLATYIESQFTLLFEDYKSSHDNILAIVNQENNLQLQIIDDTFSQGEENIQEALRLYEQLKKKIKKWDLEGLKNALQKVYCQSDNTEVVLNILKAWFPRSNKKQPLSLLFVGTSGTGKTYTAEVMGKALAEFGYKYIYFDMTLFPSEADAWKLIGSPPGYQGSTEEPRLFAAHSDSSKLIIVFDEIEKADPQIFTRLMQLLDKGELSWKNEAPRNFSECIIIFTSNLAMEQVIAAKNNLLEKGHKADSTTFQNNIKSILIANGVRTEVTGRIKSICVYNVLDDKSILQIAIQEIVNLAKDYYLHVWRIAPNILIPIVVENRNSVLGARPIKDDIERKLGAIFADFSPEDCNEIGISLTLDANQNICVTQITDFREDELELLVVTVLQMMGIEVVVEAEVPIQKPQNIDIQPFTLTLPNLIHRKVTRPDAIEKMVGLLYTEKGGQGTAFVISPDGYLLTANHCVVDMGKIEFLLYGSNEKVQAQVCYQHTTADMAILKIEKENLRYFELLTPELSIEAGEDIHLCAYPNGDKMGFKPQHFESKASKCERLHEVDLIFTAANAAPGSSGGALLRKSDGKVIGILKGGYGAEGGNINVAVDIRQLFSLPNLTINYLPLPILPEKTPPPIIVRTEDKPKKKVIKIVKTNQNPPHSKTCEELAAPLSYDICIIDTNIWLEEENESQYRNSLKTLQRLYLETKKEGKQIVILNSIYNEIQSFAKGKQHNDKPELQRIARNGFKLIREMLIDDEILWIPDIQTQWEGHNHADPLIIEFALEKYRENKSILLITKDNDCNMRTNATLKNEKSLVKYNTINGMQMVRYTTALYNKCYKDK